MSGVLSARFREERLIQTYHDLCVPCAVGKERLPDGLYVGIRSLAGNQPSVGRRGC